MEKHPHVESSLLNRLCYDSNNYQRTRAAANDTAVRLARELLSTGSAKTADIGVVALMYTSAARVPPAALGPASALTDEYHNLIMCTGAQQPCDFDEFLRRAYEVTRDPAAWGGHRSVALETLLAQIAYLELRSVFGSIMTEERRLEERRPRTGLVDTIAPAPLENPAQYRRIVYLLEEAEYHLLVAEQLLHQIAEENSVEDVVRRVNDLLHPRPNYDGACASAVMSRTPQATVSLLAHEPNVGQGDFEHSCSCGCRRTPKEGDLKDAPITDLDRDIEL